MWTSNEGIYAEYVESSGRLYFPDGSFWVFGCVAGGTEQDAGTRYPTLMQDSNGNQVLVRYHPAIGSGTPDTSARIREIEDVRAMGRTTYTLTYNADAIPHLTGITNSLLGSYYGAMYSFSYTGSYALSSPFTPPAAYGATTLLSGVTQAWTTLTHGFEYDTGGSGELLRVTMPQGGAIRWQYRTFAYSSGASVREVQYRYLRATAGGAEDVWTFLHDDNPAAPRLWTVLFDPTGAGRTWYFYTDPASWTCGLTAAYEERIVYNNPIGGRRQEFTWTQDTLGSPYIWRVDTYLDYLAASQIVARSEQTLDTHGNVTQSKVYNYGNLTTPARTYTHTYLTGTYYSMGRIWNRVTSTTLTNGTQTVTLVSNAYDGGGLVNRTGIHEHDPAYGTTNYYRGNVRTRVTPGRTVNYTYDIGGSVVSATDGQGHWVDVSQDSGTNYAAPGLITPNSASNLASSYGYDAAFAPTSATSPGYGTTSAVYDRAGRPTRTTGVFGAQTNYTYTANETVATTDVQTATGTQTRYTRTIVDGLGRTSRVTVGTASQTYSIVDTEYAACACSPLGKVRRVSQPYAPGGAVRWTTYSYDAMGRTTRVDLPDGSYSTYVYQGNTTTITDPAGKWKKYTVDAMGSLVQVTELAPEGGTHETYYAYNLLGQLTTVTMPRGGHTQTRTFNYDLTTGRLMSATNPENGTVSYTYNADGTMATKTDAKAQRTEYIYDTFQRVSQVRYYAGGVEQTCERVNYTYATNGTLEQVTWGGAACTPGTLTEHFAYGAGGKLTSTGVVVTSPERTYGAFANFGWTSEGRLSSVDYPVRREAMEHRDRFRHVYDVLGRPVGLKWQQTMNGTWPEVDYVKDVSYGGAGELLSLEYLAAGPSMAKWYTETRTYNDRLQMTRMTAQPDYAPYPRVDLEYRYPAGQNAGRISQMKDWVTGEEISYQYDSLNRLISAVTTGPEWGLSFAYDGFGNLTNQAVTKGSAPSLAVAVDPATNRMVGQSYDANGNLQGVGGYDVANRMTVQGGMQQYSYDPFNRKVWTRHSSGGGTLHLYGPSGELLGDFLLDWAEPEGIPKGPAYVYFGGRRLLTEYGGGSAAATVTDRLGSGRVTHESHPWNTASLPLQLVLPVRGDADWAGVAVCDLHGQGEPEIRDEPVVLEPVRAVHHPGPVPGERRIGESAELEQVCVCAE